MAEVAVALLRPPPPQGDQSNPDQIELTVSWCLEARGATCAEGVGGVSFSQQLIVQ